MILKVQAYSFWESAQTLSLSASGRAETDFIQIRNIDGLDPVKATVSTSAFGSVDGAAYVGSRVDTRNIVLTLHPNPDYDEWTVESLRKLLYTYFMPKSLTRLVFYLEDISPVEIYGYVESFDVNQFARDPEWLVSIICPDPYFTGVNPVILTGLTTDGNAPPTAIDYDGDIETGFALDLDYVDGSPTGHIVIRKDDLWVWTPAVVSSALRWSMNTQSGQKYIRNVNLSNGLITNLLPNMQPGSSWLTLTPGQNGMKFTTDQGGHQLWRIIYYNRYGGL